MMEYTKSDFNFNDCYWHDSILKSIFIDRSNPGHMDTIELTIDWYDEPASKIVFSDVYLFQATMHFWVIANESILDAEVVQGDDEDLIEFKEKHPGKEMNCYLIETNSTGGKIKILAAGVEKVPLTK